MSAPRVVFTMNCVCPRSGTEAAPAGKGITMDNDSFRPSAAGPRPPSSRRRSLSQYMFSILCWTCAITCEIFECVLYCCLVTVFGNDVQHLFASRTQFFHSVARTPGTLARRRD
jgi:hypothetical protein